MHSIFIREVHTSLAPGEQLTPRRQSIQAGAPEDSSDSKQSPESNKPSKYLNQGYSNRRTMLDEITQTRNSDINANESYREPLSNVDKNPNSMKVRFKTARSSFSGIEYPPAFTEGKLNAHNRTADNAHNRAADNAHNRAADIQKLSENDDNEFVPGHLNIENDQGILLGKQKTDEYNLKFGSSNDHRLNPTEGNHFHGRWNRITKSASSVAFFSATYVVQPG